MMSLYEIPQVKKQITDQKFAWCMISTPDGADCAKYDMTPEIKGTDRGPASEKLADVVGTFLSTYPGDFILHCKGHRTAAHDNFQMRYAAGQHANGSATLNGPGADLESIKAAVMADLRKEEQQREKEERLARLETINGQVADALGKVAEKVLPQLLARFMGGPQAAAMNGPEVHHATDLDPHEVMNRLLMHTDIGLLDALADYVEKNPAIVDTIGPLIGYQKPPEFEPSKHTENGTSTATE